MGKMCTSMLLLCVQIYSIDIAVNVHGESYNTLLIRSFLSTSFFFLFARSVQIFFMNRESTLSAETEPFESVMCTQAFVWQQRAGKKKKKEDCMGMERKKWKKEKKKDDLMF